MCVEPGEFSIDLERTTIAHSGYYIEKSSGTRVHMKSVSIGIATAGTKQEVDYDASLKCVCKQVGEAAIQIASIGATSKHCGIQTITRFAKCFLSLRTSTPEEVVGQRLDEVHCLVGKQMVE